MEPFSILGIVILVVLAILIFEAVAHYTHFIFFVLLALFVAVLYFGISMSQAVDWTIKTLMLVL